MRLNKFDFFIQTWNTSRKEREREREREKVEGHKGEEKKECLSGTNRTPTTTTAGSTTNTTSTRIVVAHVLFFALIENKENVPIIL